MKLCTKFSQIFREEPPGHPLSWGVFLHPKVWPTSRHCRSYWSSEETIIFFSAVAESTESSQALVSSPNFNSFTPSLFINLVMILLLGGAQNITSVLRIDSKVVGYVWLEDFQFIISCVRIVMINSRRWVLSYSRRWGEEYLH